MIEALMNYGHIALILWMLWRLDRAESRKLPPRFGLLAFRDDPVPPEAKDRRRA